ncbi:hypothetical protein M5689_015860 [Euphorbia peplus]|nr:hypothetical protein M5689_015860 [Euphorbia peplus]
MWQVLLAAAVAGSTSLVAKHFLNHHHHHHHPRKEEQEQDEAQEQEQEQDQDQDQDQEEEYSSSPEVSIGFGGEGVFRFSSSGESSGRKKGGILRKKEGVTGPRGENCKVDKRSAGFAFKKRKTAKAVPVKCGSRSSKDDSLFGWGLGVGIMYMMSAGKAEISKLSTAMDETSKVVQELKTELYKRKSSQMDAGSNNLSRNSIKVSGISINDDVECPSSVLTEEPEPQLLEMDQLEAELATELQKLPWSGTKDEVRVDELEGINTYQGSGVLPTELDRKLCHLLIEQQENQIEELESELNSAQSKLNEKEAELQALKDCVKRLTEFSLSTVSDDEGEIQIEQGCCSQWDNHNTMGADSESRKSTVGMKRPISSA